MNLTRLRLILLISLSCVLVASALILLWMVRLDKEIRSRLEQGWFSSPIEFYSSPESITAGQWLPASQLMRKLEGAGLSALNGETNLHEGEAVRWERDQCDKSFMERLPDDVASCVAFWPRGGGTQIVALNSTGKVLALFGGNPLGPVDSLIVPPILFAQYYGSSPVIRRVLDLGEVPLQCLLAVTAIEDADFLKHRGVSVTGTLRAALRNVLKARWAEGGSTITQQLVKNYFLSPEKTLSRKFTEQAMALLLEWRVNKDDILQAYLNVTYMGQHGPFEIRGFGSAARHYFGKNVEELNLPECALMAALINSPGRYSPFTAAERAKQRRNLVLEKMLNLNLIADEDAKPAMEAKLPEQPPRLLSEPAPYMVSAINRWLDEQEISRESGLKIYTSMDVDAQESAQTILSGGVKELEERFKNLKTIAESGRPLQGALVSVNLSDGRILALVGGRDFKKTQFNRILDSHRQVGSIMKPFVFGAALEGDTPEGVAYTPMTALEDTPLTHKYEGQSWTPRNYDGKFNGLVPLFYALKESLNVATARLATQVGLSNIVDFSKRAGIEAPLKALPSLSLGAFELSPFDVAQAYSTLGRMGSRMPIRFIDRVTDLNGQVIWQPEGQAKNVIAPETAAVLVGMMKQTFASGTARFASAMGFNMTAAGKTGTTSDTKDAWFAGFTPYVLTVVWVGYDDNTAHGLTGASGALPIWARFMKAYATRFPDEDFPWPEGTSHYNLGHEQLVDLLPVTDDHIPDFVDLIIKN